MLSLLQGSFLPGNDASNDWCQREGMLRKLSMTDVALGVAFTYAFTIRTLA